VGVVVERKVSRSLDGRMSIIRTVRQEEQPFVCFEGRPDGSGVESDSFVSERQYSGLTALIIEIGGGDGLGGILGGFEVSRTKCCWRSGTVGFGTGGY
jgi:hypothetical protein